MDFFLIFSIWSSRSYFRCHGMLRYKCTWSNYRKATFRQNVIHFQQGIFICPISINRYRYCLFSGSWEFFYFFTYNWRNTASKNRRCNNSHFTFRLLHHRFFTSQIMPDYFFFHRIRKNTTHFFRSSRGTEIVYLHFFFNLINVWIILCC